MRADKNETAGGSLDDVARLLWDVGETGANSDEAHFLIDEMSRLLWVISDRGVDEDQAVRPLLSSSLP